MVIICRNKWFCLQTIVLRLTFSSDLLGFVFCIRSYLWRIASSAVSLICDVQILYEKFNGKIMPYLDDALIIFAVFLCNHCDLAALLEYSLSQIVKPKDLIRPTYE